VLDLALAKAPVPLPDEEVPLAVPAAESAAKESARGRKTSKSDPLPH
jgi:hypothetical protein